MEGLNEYEETALLVATLRRDWKEALPPEVLSDLCVRLARVGADSRAAAKKTSMAFENASVAVSHRVLRRVRDILCSLLLGEAGKMNDPIRSAVRLAFSEAWRRGARGRGDAFRHHARKLHRRGAQTREPSRRRTAGLRLKSEGKGETS